MMNIFINVELKAFALIGVAMISLGSFAQNEDDVLRYSYLLGGGTARSSSMAGAMGAVGADLSAASINPAGLGLYRTSEFTLSLGFEVNNSDVTHYGTKSTDSDQRFFANDLGVVLSYGEKEGTHWKGMVFGVSFDRLNSYNWNSNAVGESVPSTLLQQFALQANGTPPGQLLDEFGFTSGLAYETYAIDPDTAGGGFNVYMPAIPFGSLVRQEHTVDMKGALNNTSFFFAANHDHKVFFGGALGIVGVRFDRYTVHRETTLDENLALRTATYKEDLIIRGNGFDLKLGLLVRPTDELRIGAAVHTPMLLSLSDVYTTDMSTKFRDGDSYDLGSAEGTFSYRINTPWRATGSLAYIVGKTGLVSFDYEFADMSSGKLKRSYNIANEANFSEENRSVKERFSQLHSFRVGTEWRKNNWYIRAGFGLTPDPYVDADPLHGTARTNYAGGLGYRTPRISLDLGMQVVNNEIMFQQYAPSLVEPTIEQRSAVRSLMTFAYRP